MVRARGCRLHCLVFTLALIWAVASAGFVLAADVTVFAAASLTDALEKISGLYAKQSADRIKLSFASSSTLARQIEAGAPADIFASANEDWMNYLAREGLIAETTRVSPLGNSLVLIAPADSALNAVDVGPGLDIAKLLGPGNRLAVGDPQHVPVGVYAKEAFETWGVWAKVEPLLARTDDVRAALALVKRGEATLGIAYATDARITDKVKVVGTFPAGGHAPIVYPFAIVADRDRPEVRRFFAFATGPEGKKVFADFGFDSH